MSQEVKLAQEMFPNMFRCARIAGRTLPVAACRRYQCSAAKSNKMDVKIAHANRNVPQDSLTTRIMGSDWGDRRGQTVSFAMKFYWTIFAGFILNGLFTEFIGKEGMCANVA
jgi:hypothetical protein